MKARAFVECLIVHTRGERRDIFPQAGAISIVAVEFHCEHCNKLIKASLSTAGQTGKCPHCKGVNYIPLPEDESGELPLAPLDEDFEKRRAQTAAEDAALVHKLLRESESPKERNRRKGFRRPDVSTAAPAPVPPPPMPRKQLTSLVVQFIEAMSQGQLERADKLVGELAGRKDQVRPILDELLTEDLSGYGLPALPRPVLVGFVKQLRTRL